MRRLTLALCLLTLASPALAQGVTVSPSEGNWGCIALIDNTKAGLLTVFAGSYGYASANFGSAASGTGSAEMGSDGVRFLDGNLATIGNRLRPRHLQPRRRRRADPLQSGKGRPGLHAAIGASSE